MPAWLKVCEALAPFDSTPVLKLPSLAVAVCAVGPSFVQVIVSPTWTVIVAGVNLKSEIVSPAAPAARASGTTNVWCTARLAAARAAAGGGAGVFAGVEAAVCGLGALAVVCGWGFAATPW